MPSFPAPATTIFREYDIRGIAGGTLTDEVAYVIGRAFASWLGSGTVCVGRDGRLSSPALSEALMRGIAEAGCDVIDVGLGPTPMLYYAAHVLKADGGVMITGSHNPPDHNGFKFVARGKPFYGEDIQRLRARIGAADFSNGQGARSNKDVCEAYIGELLKAYAGKRELAVAWDAGNGAAGEVMEALCGRLPGRHIALNEKIDGTFPAHHPDPAEAKNLAQLIEAVRAQKLDCGIAFDGDGDRVGVVDDEGEILWGDQLMMLYARDVLEHHPGATIIADVKSSQLLFDWIAQFGGKPLMWKTGHSNIKAKMAETGALLAGEMSGHMFFADNYYGYDDGIYAAVRVLSILSRSGKKLSDLRKALPRAVSTPELRFDCDDTRKFTVIEEVKQRLKATSAEFSDIDGVRVNTKQGWWLLRASNTQPMLVARCEACDAVSLADLKKALKEQLTQSGMALPL